MSGALVYVSARMEVTCSGGMYTVELTDEQRLRQGKGILLLTHAELVELCRLDDATR